MKNDILDYPVPENNLKEKAKNFFILLIFFCFVCETLFVVEIWRVGNKDILGGVIKSILILSSLFVFYFGFSWVKWIITPSLILLSIACFLGAAEQSSVLMLFIGIYYLYLAFLLPISKRLKFLDRKSNV
ncbi:hypothetical protein WAF17_02205 [Bernardetia sp. ABR2-2B]|uniref:hypothetical protein n=1 Tax=Bernardetia sp. ABR2-2B TaxID=3127472 RepID=UPI0030CC4273